MNETGNVNENELKRATEESLQDQCKKYLNIENETLELENSDVNKELIKFTLDHTERDLESGRLIMSVLWNPQIKHLLPRNYTLASKILLSTTRKLKKNKERLLQYNDVIKQQEMDNIIEPIYDLNQFLKENSECHISFLAHNGVFRPTATSTKCRVVFLSNLCEKFQPNAVSHNQCSLPGANLNHKLATALLLLRFDTYLLTFDLKKAFLQIILKKLDTDKLLFLWYNDVLEDNFSVIAYRMLRLPFGLRFSPFLLMMALYIILIQNTEGDNAEKISIKKCLYDLAYMDNIAYSANTTEKLETAVTTSKELFKEYGFQLQQFTTNHSKLQKKLYIEMDQEPEEESKLFGLVWLKDKDALKTRKLYLDPKAATKRLVLQTLNANFDLYGIYIPVLNRARLFLHILQCDKELSWDEKFSMEKTGEWIKICKQINNSSEITIPRMIGARSSAYKLICFTDASKEIYGCVIYLQEICAEISFVMAKNRIVNKQLASKTIPVLELVAMQFGSKVLIDLYQQLTNAVQPINIEEINLYSDSMVALAWLKMVAHDFGKIEKKNIFINNKLREITKLCQTFPIQFNHTAGLQNPADHVTRTVSAKLLAKSNFLKGPEFLNKEDAFNEMKITVPHPEARSSVTVAIVSSEFTTKSLIQIDKFSSFKKATRIIENIFKFVYIIKSKLLKKDPVRFAHFKETNEENLREKSYFCLIRAAQHKNYKEVHDFFQQKKSTKTLLPIISQLNLFIDETGIIRVKSKMKKLKAEFKERCPILLDRNCPLTKSIILDAHEDLNHGGVYNVLSILRKHFWITKCFATVKSILKNCILCKRLNNRSITLNKNAYKNYRINPEMIAFRNIIIDHIGPFYIKKFNKKEKIYVLLISCLWSRAVSLIVCHQIDTEAFLRAFQIHIYEYGIPSIIVSDMGSPIVSGINKTIDFLDDIETKEYLREHNIQRMEYQPYPSGASWLGGAIETLVKQVKKLVYGGIRNNILDYFDFEFMIKQINMLINKRPIAFKNLLSDPSAHDEELQPLTPEMILKGYEVPSVNILPQMQTIPEMYENDKIWNFPNEKCIGSNGVLQHRFEQLKRIRSKINSLYHGEFIQTLMEQATNRKNAFALKTHKKLSVGDLVSIKQTFSKPYQFPMGIVHEVEENDLGEIVSAKIRKANREIVRKHASDIILLSKNSETAETDRSDVCSESTIDVLPVLNNTPKVKRLAAKQCNQLNKQLFVNQMV